MTIIDKYKKSDVWKRRGTNFMIEIVRWDFCNGTNIWNIYAYIFPRHPHFKKFEEHDTDQPASECLNFHGGPTYLQYHFDKDEHTSIQVGCDYNHWKDDNLNQHKTPEQAYEVFEDADRLFDQLEQNIELC